MTNDDEALLWGGGIVTALGIAAVAAHAGTAPETSDQLADRLVAETLRRGNAGARLNAFAEDRSLPVGKVFLGTAVLATVAWALWPVPEPTVVEKQALTALGVTVMPPGRVVCPVTTVPLRWSPDVGRAVGYDRWVLLNKEGWRFLAPATTVAKSSIDSAITGGEGPLGRVAESLAKLAVEV